MKEFWGLPLQLSPDTLVPRPDTETLVEAALELLDATGPRDRPLVIADLGTGSGAILLALLSELTNATGIATDINLDALRTARSNAGATRLDRRAHFAVSRLCLSPGRRLRPRSSPIRPIFPRPTLPASTSRCATTTPLRALDGGKDGLNAYRTIAPEAARLLVPGGLRWSRWATTKATMSPV